MINATEAKRLITRTGSEWMEDKAPKLAGALAYYTAVSIAPLLVITVLILSKVLGGEDAAQHRVVEQMRQLIGGPAAETAKEVMKNANQESSGILATIVSLAVLLFGASGVFGELQDSMNTIWKVRAKPNQGIWGFVRSHFLSLTMVLAVAFVLLVSLVVSTVVTGVTKYVGGGIALIGNVFDLVGSLAVIALLFALLFKYLPDVKIEWRTVWPGAILTAVLFTIGKYLLGLYISRGSTTSAYGAAGSLAALLIWVYYSAQILFFGAEFTKVYAEENHHLFEPSANAIPLDEQRRVEQGIGHDRDKAEPKSSPSASAVPSFATPRRAAMIAQYASYSQANEDPQMQRKHILLATGGFVAGAAAGALGAIFGQKRGARLLQLLSD